MNHGLINEHRERSLVLHRLAESILARPLLLAALTLYWTWVNMAFQGPLFFPSVVLSSGVLFPSWIGPVGVSAVAYFALAYGSSARTSCFASAGTSESSVP